MNESMSINDLISSILDRVTSDASLLGSLETMRTNQHAHERAWFEARYVISKKYETKRTLNAMMVSIGGAEGVSGDDLRRLESEELCAFDGKLRAAMVGMYRTQEKELEKLGVRVTGVRGEGEGEGMGRVYRVLDELLDERARQG